MHGFIILMFKEEDLPKDKDDEKKFEGMPGYYRANNVGSDFHVMCEDGMQFARMPLDIDVLTGLAEPEDNLPALEKKPKITLHLWVTVNRSKPSRLSCGTWTSGDIRVRIMNDPAQHDQERMRITVVAPTVEEARQAVRDTLEGKKKSDVAWII